MKSSVQWGQASGGRCRGDQRGVEQPSGVSAVVWSLSQLALESGALHALGPLLSVLAPLMLSGEFALEPTDGTWLILTPLLASTDFHQEPVSGWSRSADMAGLIPCADTLGASPCQMCLR